MDDRPEDYEVALATPDDFTVRATPPGPALFGRSGALAVTYVTSPQVAVVSTSTQPYASRPGGMSFFNATPFACLDVPTLAGDGREVVVALLKATYALAPGGVVRAAQQRPVRLGDEVYDADVEHSSVRLPADVGVAKIGADVVVVGSAFALKPVRSMIVGVAVGEHVVQLRVHGERQYFRGAAGQVSVGDAAAFTDKPIVYERAYGGTSADYSKVERRNPVGRGIVNDASELVGMPAPQIEHLAQPIKSAVDRPTPVGFGAIASHWAPRADHYGTIDDTFLRDRLPLMPFDHDLRFNNVAHPDLQRRERLAPGTPVRVEGMSAEPIAFAIPKLTAHAVARFDDGGVDTVPMPLDTLLVDTEARVIELGCRACFALGRGKRRLRELRVALGPQSHSS